MKLSPERAKRADLGMSLTFVAQAFMAISWLPRIPEVIKQIDVDFTTWGLIIGVSGLGSLLPLMFTHRVIARFGSGRVIRISAWTQVILFSSFPFIHTGWLFFLVNFINSFVGSFLGIGMNGQGVALQKMLKRTILPKFHASWSIGAAASSAVSGIFATFLPLSIHLPLVTIICGVLVHYATTLGLQQNEEKQADTHITETKKVPFFRSPGYLWLLMLGVFCSVYPEVSVMDWAAVFAKDVLKQPAGLNTIPYTVFVTCMIMGRLSIGRLSQRWHISQISRVASLIGLVGLGTGAFLGGWVSLTNTSLALVITSVAWGVAGFGLAPLVPSFFGAAGNVPGLTTPQALSRMALVNTVNFMLAKILMGALAENTNLVAAYVFPTSLLLVASLMAGVVVRRARREDTLLNA
ncbi:MAG: hypothetical protein RL670_34, partial [Actinomycetota bacterium]